MTFDQPAGRAGRDHPKRLWFKDQLHFGTLKLVNATELERKLGELGCDVLVGLGKEGALSPSQWESLCAKRASWTFPKLLMDQKSISGVGNYLKSEILFKARISPHRLISSCGDDELERVYEAVVTIPRWALETKLRMGLAIRGRFNMKIYRKKIVEGFVVKREKTSDNRTTHWVPELQH
jgi:formamidopyrimidine-DNA glycosylase